MAIEAVSDIRRASASAFGGGGAAANTGDIQWALSAGNRAEPEWLPCNGRPIDATAYPQLAALLRESAPALPFVSAGTIATISLASMTNYGFAFVPYRNTFVIRRNDSAGGAISWYSGDYTSAAWQMLSTETGIITIGRNCLGLAYSRSGRLVAVLDDFNNLFLYGSRVEGGSGLYKIGTAFPSVSGKKANMMFSGNGQVLVSTHGNGYVLPIDVSEQSSTTLASVYTGGPNSDGLLAVSYDGRFIVGGTGLLRRAFNTYTKLLDLPLTYNLLAVSFSDDGRFILALTTSTGTNWYLETFVYDPINDTYTKTGAPANYAFGVACVGLVPIRCYDAFYINDTSSVTNAFYVIRNAFTGNYDVMNGPCASPNGQTMLVEGFSLDGLLAVYRESPTPSNYFFIKNTMQRCVPSIDAAPLQLYIKT